MPRASVFSLASSVSRASPPGACSLAPLLSGSRASPPRRSLRTSRRVDMPLVVISPAKTLNYDAPLPRGVPAATTPRFLASDTRELLATARTLDARAIKSLMGVSDAIAALNAERFASWDDAPARSCAFAFDGPAFRALDAFSLDASAAERLQSRVRVLSGAYGLLRPLDEVRPHRMEMGTKLETRRGKDLYAFWGDRVAEAIAEDVAALPEKERFVVNCASQEYWRAARETHLAERLGVRVVTCAFPGPAVHAKSARGAMARHVAEGAETMEDLARFRGRRGEWRVDDEQSDEKTLVFRRVEEASAEPRAGAKKRDASAEPRAGAKKRDDARTPAPRKRIRKTSA